MKYGAHIYLWVERFGTGKLRGLLDNAAALGLSFLEIPVGDDVAFDARAVGRQARRLGISLVLSPGALWPMRYDISLASGAARRAGVAEFLLPGARSGAMHGVR